MPAKTKTKKAPSFSRAPFRSQPFLHVLRFLAELTLGIGFASLLLLLAWFDYRGVWNRAALSSSKQLWQLIQQKDDQIAELQGAVLSTKENTVGDRQPLRVGMRVDERVVFATSSGVTFSVLYTNKAQGLSLYVPYDPAWGIGSSFALPFEERESNGYKTVFFGSFGMGCFEGCTGYRSMDMSFLPARDKTMAMNEFRARNKNLPAGVPTSAKVLQVGDVAILRFETRALPVLSEGDATKANLYTRPIIWYEAFGKKANYVFHGPEDEVMKVIRTMRFI